MPRTQITITDILRDGVAPGVVTVADAINNHYILGNDGQVFFQVINTGGAQTIEFETPLEVDDLALSSEIVDIPAGTTILGNFRRKTFNQSTDGTVYINPSASGSMEIRAFRATAAG